MLPTIDFRQTKAHQKLENHLETIRGKHLRELFENDPERFQRFSLRQEEILFDYSKNLIEPKTMELLLKMAEECELPRAIRQQFEGMLINQTEGRAVLHTALRNRSSEPVLVGGKDVMPLVERVLEQMRVFSEKVISGEWKGYSGKAIETVVNIGIGGSDLGPHMVCEALKAYRTPLTMHFVSNIDGTHLSETLKQCDPETTLFVVASKTFTTQETMTNARSARSWFLESAGKKKHIASHFVAVSTNLEAVESFGIDPDNCFAFWDWVGGRFSLWSAIGLPICLGVGYTHFEALLEGAHSMDQHFRQADFSENIPVIMAMLGIWYHHFLGAETHAILPYSQYMHLFPTYFQQTDMESNGKGMNREGKAVGYNTGPVIWGGAGTNGQHAFFQLLHQSPRLIPCDFLAPAVSQNPMGEHHEILLSNFFAQTEALMNGKTRKEVKEELQALGMEKEELKALVPFKVFPGNKPSTSILFKELNPRTLGSLIALYEHKVFVQGVVWNIFSFDQWGVELGKQLARHILPELLDSHKVKTHDSSTNGLINAFKAFRKA